MLTYLYNLLKGYTTSTPKPTPKKRSHTRWTTEETADLLRMFTSKVPLTIIAYELDRSFSSISSKLTTLGFSWRNHPTTLEK